MMLIKKIALEFILGVSKNIHPNEFTGLLRGTEKIIEEILIIPNSVFGDGFAVTRFDMVPFDRSIIGSVHSHPGNKFNPSRADIHFFGKIGVIHLILRYPYAGSSDVAAYDRNGNRTELNVLVDGVEEDNSEDEDNIEDDLEYIE